jgi:hypothetical protein
MANYMFQLHHGHIITHVEGRSYLLDTGAPFSVGYEPIHIAGKRYPVEWSYMGVTPSHLSEYIGMPIEGMIGSDIIREYTMGVYATERIVQFTYLPTSGDIVLPVQVCGELPIISVMVNGMVRRMFFDTGAPTSYLLPEALEGVEVIGRHEDYYPLLGNFLTDIYSLPVVLASEQREFRFGCVPEEMRSALEAARVSGMIGTELLRHFGMTLSLRDKAMCLETPRVLPGVANG